MDPSSLSVSNDPHHPPQFTAYPPFTNSNPYGGPNQHFFGGGANHAVVAPPNDNHLFQALPQPPPVPPHPSFNHPPYSDMICTAIAALNEPDGSSKQAISRYIERIYTGIPSAHGALLTHHLKTLKNSGVLMMVKKSYKFVASPPPASVAVAAAAAAAGLEPPRSDFTSNTVNENKPLPDPAATSTPQTQKRGRGRPPKPKPEATPISDIQTNGKPSWEISELPVSRPEEEIQQPSIKRPPGRPRKDGTSPSPRVQASPTVQDSPAVDAPPIVPSIARRRGRPPSGRAAGRERKPTIVSAPVSVIPYVANGGVRRRGRPRRVDVGASSVAPQQAPNAESGGEGAGLVVAKRRGRGRPPKIGGVTRKLMKPMRRVSRTGRPLGRPRKDALSRGPSGLQDAAYGELRKKFELFQARAKDIVNVLKAEIGASENQAVVQAIQLLEELTVTTATETREEPQLMEEVQAEEEHPDPQPQPQPQPEPLSEPQPEAEGQGQAQTEAEAMQEALF